MSRLNNSKGQCLKIASWNVLKINQHLNLIVPVSLQIPICKLLIHSQTVASQEASLIVICPAVTTLFHLTVSTSGYILRVIII